jgi:hypothetical protein
MEGRMVRRSDRPLRIVRISFETTRLSAGHLIEAYACLVPMVRRTRASLRRGKIGSTRIDAMTAKRRRGEP